MAFEELFMSAFGTMFTVAIGLGLVLGIMFARIGIRLGRTEGLVASMRRDSAMPAEYSEFRKEIANFREEMRKLRDEQRD